MVMLQKDDILRGLRKTDERAKGAGVLIDRSIYGGAALAIASNLRHATRDVDAIVHGAPDFLRLVADEIAEEKNWPLNWLNDSVKDFTSASEHN